MANPGLKLVSPTTENRTVMPRRRKNAELRSREYLTEHEIEALMAAARQNRHGHRDATMILVAFRHGLRAAETVDLRWDQVDFRTATLHVRRVKGGTRARIRSSATSYAPYGVCNAIRNPSRPSCSPRSGAHRSPRPASPAWSSGQGGRPLGLQGTSAHAAARLWLRAGQRGPGYEGAASLPRAPQYSAYRALYRVIADRFKDFWRD